MLKLVIAAVLVVGSRMVMGSTAMPGSRGEDFCANNGTLYCKCDPGYTGQYCKTSESISLSVHRYCVPI